MGPAASSGKADERSLPVQKPTRKSKVGMRKLRQKKGNDSCLGAFEQV